MSLDQIAGRPTPLASLTRATSRIARARSMDEVVETIRSAARSLIGCQGISIIRREGNLCHYVEEDAIGPLWKGQRFPAADCISGWAMANRQTVVISDISRDARVPQDLYANTFVRSLMMAPVRPGDPVGAIGAYWSQPYSPSQWEIETLEALTEAATTAVENIGLVAVLLNSVDETSRVEADAGLAGDIQAIAGVGAVRDILDMALRMTGMGFAAVARVTETRWIACQVLDHLGFGLKPGDELPVESTSGNAMRDHRRAIVFDDAAADPDRREHDAPRIYGLRSYISVPIILPNGKFWGTLCTIDSSSVKINKLQVVGSFKLFAELIAQHLGVGDKLQVSPGSLDQEHEPQT